MNFILKGSICYSISPKEFMTLENGYLVCEGGISRGIFSEIPDKFSGFPINDCGNKIIIPGLIDLHVHAPQYAYRGLGMDLQLLNWLSTYAFAEESKYSNPAYADEAYNAFVSDLKRGATTRANVFATIHNPATILLMEKLEQSGLVTHVGKVNMDRNSPDILREASAQVSYEDTRCWIKQVKGKFKNTRPIITPRFIPTCSDELMQGLGVLQREYGLPVQSHLSENDEEIAWVDELHPKSKSYAEAYNSFGLFGNNAAAPTVMAHCVHSAGAEEALIKQNGVYVAHCPQSNTNLASGIAPIRRFLDNGLRIGLGSDVAGGCHTSIFRAMSDAIQVSKLYWRLIEQNDVPLTEKEAFYLGTAGGGSFFGKVGSFEDGYEFDALVIDDSSIHPQPSRNLSIENRVARIIYLAGDVAICGKYVCGKNIF